MNRPAELRRLMHEVEDQYDARVIDARERSRRYVELNDEYKALTGRYYTTGRRMIDPVRCEVHHERQYLHQYVSEGRR